MFGLKRRREGAASKDVLLVQSVQLPEPTVFLDTLAEVLAAAGHLDEALAAADEALLHLDRGCRAGARAALLTRRPVY
jgi:hypothetical protein